jgi:hypothetical protein
MNDNLQQLVVICQKMYDEGKTPSVGMLRSKAPFKVSVTEAIEAIKRFNASKKITPSASSNDKDDEMTRNTLVQRVEALEKEVSELKQTLNAIVSKTKS